MSARRYTNGKLRYELIPAGFLKELAKVYTIGADKYSIKDENNNIIDDGAENWRKGLSWNQTLGAIYRHLEKFKMGEDFDTDYPKEYLDKYGPTYHLANAAWGIATLLEYYKIYPQGDNRPKTYLNPIKIGLDIDEVICDWLGGWCKRYNIDRPTAWNFHRDISKEFDKLEKEGCLDEFMLSLTPLVKPEDIPFEPHCYITSRRINNGITEQWLDKHNFPSMPVYTVPPNISKVDVARKAGVTMFIDDRYENFVELNNAGICTFLMDAEHNKRYNVGYKRIYNFNDFAKRFL